VVLEDVVVVDHRLPHVLAAVVGGGVAQVVRLPVDQVPAAAVGEEARRRSASLCAPEGSLCAWQPREWAARRRGTYTFRRQRSYPAFPAEISLRILPATSVSPILIEHA
jgi:hypothetical protein